MWKNVRILLLLVVLLGVAVSAWLDRRATQGWHDTLWVGIFPLNADGSDDVQRYLDSLGPGDFAPVEAFLAREGRRYHLATDTPVHVELYPQRTELPPELAPGSDPLAAAWWSLKMRWYARRASTVPGRAPPRIRLFVMYHDPATLTQVPDSHGLQKGLVGVVHAYADRTLAPRNAVVIAHELLHTVGATDKYDPGTGAPLYPIGYAEPDRQPLYPQPLAEIMAGRRALSPAESEMPASLAGCVVGPATALEIRWTH